MVAVPAATPVTIPVLLTVAIPVELLVQVPPPVASESVTVPPIQTFAVPVIEATTGSAFTVNIAVAVFEHPVPLDTV